MANSKQALKRARQSEKHRVNNKWQFTRMNTVIKQVLAAIDEKSLEKAQAAYQQASSTVDKLASKGIIHKNKASRIKSRLNKHLKALAA